MNLLELNHVEKSFGDLSVLKDISLSVSEGEIVSIIGPSGSGKSTLLRDDAGDDGPRRDRIFRKESSLDGRGWQGQLCGQEGHEGDPQPVRSGIPEF